MTRRATPVTVVTGNRQGIGSADRTTRQHVTAACSAYVHRVRALLVIACGIPAWGPTVATPVTGEINA
jgi:hypothetical protein